MNISRLRDLREGTIAYPSLPALHVEKLNVFWHRAVNNSTARQNASLVRSVGLENGKQACAMIRISRVEAVELISSAFVAWNTVRCFIMELSSNCPSGPRSKSATRSLKCASSIGLTAL
jgi:hypothetical protein